MPADAQVDFANGVVATVEGFTPRRLTGYHLAETAGAVAHVRLRDGTVTGKILATIKLPASGSDHETEMNRVSAGGIFMQLVAGTVEGSIFVRP